MDVDRQDVGSDQVPPPPAVGAGQSRSRVVAVLLVAAVMLTVVVLVWQRGSAGPGADIGVLALPAAGEVEPAFVGDDPVYVVRDPDGEVHVLDAVSPHAPRGMHKVVAWCRSSHLFEDLWHGSKFQADGTWVGGPAPTGLTAYRTTVLGDTIVVGPSYAAPARPGPDDSAGPQPDGPSCDERTQMGGVVDRGVLDDLLLHPKPPIDDGLVYPDEQSVLGVPVVTPS